MRTRSSKRNSKFSFQEIHEKKIQKKVRKNNKKSNQTEEMEKREEEVKYPFKKNNSRVEILVTTSTAVLYQPSYVYESSDDIDETNDDKSSGISINCDLCDSDSLSHTDQTGQTTEEFEKENEPITKRRRICEDTVDKQTARTN